ncbi:MAG: hypothetical protein ACT4QA_21435 [Panacagrimonas sp.]
MTSPLPSPPGDGAELPIPSVDPETGRLVTTEGSTSVAVVAAVPAVPEVAERQRLLDEMQQDRDELMDVAGRLRGPVKTLETAKNLVVFTGRSVRWIALAGNLLAIAMYMRNGRRPPLTLLVGVSVQLFGAWSKVSAKAGARPLAPLPAPPLRSIPARTRA